MTLSTRRVTLGVNCAGAEGVLEVRQAPDNASASMRRRAARPREAVYFVRDPPAESVEVYRKGYILGYKS